MIKSNLAVKNRDYSVFTPALSGFYVHYVSKQQHYNYVEPERIPKNFENGVEGLNFLNSKDGYFYYDHFLYSAGHAELDLNKAQIPEGMVHNRNRENTTLIGDSGGFQISKGVWQGNWLSPEGSCAKTDKQRGLVLNWLENTADYSMFLDIPTAGLFHLNADGKPRCGLNNYEEFRDATIENNKYFFNHTQGKTKFLNVLQGTTYQEADDWFEKVCKPVIPYTKGWAFGGVQKTNANHSLRRLLMLKDLGLLDKQHAEWIHFLGTGRCDHAVTYTAIQRALRKYVNESITISFDCASPFIAVANGQVYTHNVFTDKRFSYIMDKMVDDKVTGNKDDPWPWDSSPVGARLTWRDINYYNPGDLNKNGKEGKTSWDSFAYALMMGHNVYEHINATQMANRLASRPSPQMNTWIPRHYLEFQDIVDELFSKDYGANQQAVDAELNKHNKLLQLVSRTKDLRKGNTFSLLFEEENVVDYESDEFEEDSNGKLAQLEKTHE